MIWIKNKNLNQIRLQMSDGKTIIKKESTKTGFNLTYSDGSQLFIDGETYFKKNVYEKNYLAEPEIIEIKEKTEARQCYNKALSYLLNGSKTENRLRIYLENKRFSYKAVNMAVDLLKGDNKINDFEFINKYINKQLKQNIKRDKLIAKLIYQGISQEIAIEAVDKVIKNDEDTY